MNELEKQLAEVIHQRKDSWLTDDIPIMTESEWIAKGLSKLFLEKIKEAYKVGTGNIYSRNSPDDYLKSKYNIDHHQER